MAETARTKYYLFSQTRVIGIPILPARPFDSAKLKEPHHGFAYLYGKRRPVAIAAVEGIPHALQLTLNGVENSKPIHAAGPRLDAADVQIKSPIPLVRRHIVVRQEVAA